MSMATRSSGSSPTESSKPLFQKSFFICGKARIRQNKKELVAKKSFATLAEATIKAVAKDRWVIFIS